MALTKICVVGANGLVGTAMMEELVRDGSFEISVLRRSTSTSKPAAPTVNEISVSPDWPLDELTEALRGQDVVVNSVRPASVPQHERLAEAACRAGVKRFFPADFGSCDAQSPRAQSLLNLYRVKVKLQANCEELAARNSGFSWTTIICGHFFDYGLESGLLHFDLASRSGQLVDGGDIPASASTLRRVGEALVAALRRPDETRNRVLFVQSFCPTQRDILAALEKATGGKWTTTDIKSGPTLAHLKPKADAGDKEAVEEIVGVLGAIDADWTKRDAFAMDLLGLKDENLDEVVAAVVAKSSKSKGA